MFGIDKECHYTVITISNRYMNDVFSFSPRLSMIITAEDFSKVIDSLFLQDGIATNTFN